MRYIGSKNRILDFIKETVRSTYGNFSDAVVADLFAGTACVAEMFKSAGSEVISNDYLYFSYAMQIAKIKLNAAPNCALEYEQALEELNTLTGVNGFFFNEYTFEGRGKRNYFSADNGKKIDSICVQLKKWLKDGIINLDMYYLLSASLIDAITKVSNTSGTYGAFLKINDERKTKPLVLEKLSFLDNGKRNSCYCHDIFDVIDSVAGDILYLDPPYNSRQYPPYYHILETAVLYDDPAIYGVTGRRPYQDKLSPFCLKEKALSAMVEVVKAARFPHIYISYSTDGIIPYKDMIEALSRFGPTECFFQGYRRYKSNDGGHLVEPLKEIIIYVKKG